MPVNEYPAYDETLTDEVTIFFSDAPHFVLVGGGFHSLGQILPHFISFSKISSLIVRLLLSMCMTTMVSLKFFNLRLQLDE